MNNGIKIIALSLSSLMLFVSCGQKESESTEQSVPAPPPKPSASTADAVAAEAAAAAAELEAAKTKIRTEAAAEMETRLAAEKEALMSQFQATNQTLRNQVDSLTQKFNAAKTQLPSEVVEPFSEKLPKLDASVDTLESLVSQFSPDTIEQVEAFKTKYERELAIAQQLAGELMKLMNNTSIGDSLKKIPGF